MISDSLKVLKLIESRNNGNLYLDPIIHEETRPLIESISASLCSNSSGQFNFDDLVQEGHLKLQRVVVSGSYKTIRGTLYSFLSSVLKNAMIDFIRKCTKEVLLSDRDEYAIHLLDKTMYGELGRNDDVPIRMLSDLSDYMICRFPSVQDYLALSDASTYIVIAIYESVYNKSQGIQKTVSFVYDFSLRLSRILYRSTVIFLRLHALGKLNYPNSPEEFLRANPSYEMSNIPDIALFIGCEDIHTFLSVFNGMKITI